MVSLYMPSECAPSAFNEYLNTLGELEGFLESQQCILVGDFNADFDRGGSLPKLLAVFLSELNICACDLSFRGLITTLMKEMMAGMMGVGRGRMSLIRSLV